ncbi:hypothetical protein ACIPEN_22075 [Herbaspirillum chlorophenolicum]|uniref:Curli assembly protein CsgC n=1 Tax=Herbaspirillum chlorophenolicum TaxID=211589 RepID=A0ABW8F5H0_9BURK
MDNNILRVPVRIYSRILSLVFCLWAPIISSAQTIAYPYIAQLSCTIGGGSIPIQSCFYDADGGTQLELQTSESYKMLQHMQILQAGKIYPNGMLQINLSEKFRLAVQNASPNALLNVKILDSTTGKILFEKSAGRYGVIPVQN